MKDMKKRILIIDDDPFMVRAIEFTLVQRGFDVRSVSNAEDAFNQIESENFDFFLVDLVLPGINGFEFVRRLKKDPRFKNTPVLIITARMDVKDHQSAITAGADDILIKPFELEVMAERIEKLIS